MLSENLCKIHKVQDAALQNLNTRTKSQKAQLFHLFKQINGSTWKAQY